jgi:hypothetical protein
LLLAGSLGGGHWLSGDWSLLLAGGFSGGHWLSAGLGWHVGSNTVGALDVKRRV